MRTQLQIKIEKKTAKKLFVFNILKLRVNTKTLNYYKNYILNKLFYFIFTTTFINFTHVITVYFVCKKHIFLITTKLCQLREKWYLCLIKKILLQALGYQGPAYGLVFKLSSRSAI